MESYSIYSCVWPFFTQHQVFEIPRVFLISLLNHYVLSIPWVLQSLGLCGYKTWTSEIEKRFFFLMLFCYIISSLWPRFIHLSRKGSRMARKCGGNLPKAPRIILSRSQEQSPDFNPGSLEHLLLTLLPPFPGFPGGFKGLKDLKNCLLRRRRKMESFEICIAFY